MAEVNKISSFKSFSEIKSQESSMKLREENNQKRKQTLSKIEEILDEMGLTNLSEIDEDSQKAFISKLLGREMNEGNAFVYAASKAKAEGKDEFEFNGKKYKVTIKDTGVKEGNAFGDAVRKAKEEGATEFEFEGETYKVEENLDEAISRSEYDRMDGLHNIKAMKSLIDSAKTIFDDLSEEMFEFDEICDFIIMKIKKSKLAGMYESTVNEGAHGMATKLLQSIVNGESSKAEGVKMSKELAQHYIDWIRTSPYGKKNSRLPLNMLIDASFNWGIERGTDAKLKGEIKDLKSSIKESLVNEGAIEIVYYSEVIDNWGRTESSSKPNVIAKLLQSPDDWTDDQTFEDKLGKPYDIDSLIGKTVKVGNKTFKVEESVVNEGAVKAFEMDYADMVKNIKSGYGWIDPEYVADTWENSSDSIDFELVKGEIYNRLIKAGLLAYADEDDEENAGKKVKSLKELGIKESYVTEAEIKSDDEFKEYAFSVLKKAFGSDFDEAKAGDVVKGILGKADGDYGAAVGMLTSSLGESVVVEGFDANYWEDYHEGTDKIKNPSGMQIMQEVEDAVESWNDNNEDGKENEVTPAGEKKVLKLAKEFVKAKGWISSDVIDAMIAQES